MEELLVRYLHFTGLIILAAALVSQHLLLRKTMTPAAIRKIAVIDGIYGAGAMLMLVSGLLLWFIVGKPDTFYSANFIFHIKLLLFAVIAVLSTIPTWFYLRNRRTDTSRIPVPRRIIRIIRTELLLLLLMPLLAVTMARGIGSTSG